LLSTKPFKVTLVFAYTMHTMWLLLLLDFIQQLRDNLEQTVQGIFIIYVCPQITGRFEWILQGTDKIGIDRKYRNYQKWRKGNRASHDTVPNELIMRDPVPN